VTGVLAAGGWRALDQLQIAGDQLEEVNEIATFAAQKLDHVLA
jgi:hypothetical protein